MRMLLHNRLGGWQICQPTSYKRHQVRRRLSMGSLILIIFLLAPIGGCASLDDLASGESWFTAEPLATYAARYTEPIILTPLAGDEIAASDDEFKSVVDFSLKMGPVQPQDQMDLHKANLISLLTNKSSRGSIAPWEGSIELGQQISSTSIWLASLETKYEPNLPFEADSEYVPMGILAMALNDGESNLNKDTYEDENETDVASSIFDVSQNTLGISPGLIASTSSGNLAWGEIISTSLRWVAMVFLAVVLLIPAGCSYAARLIGKRSTSSPSHRRCRSDDHAPSAISRAISNVASR